MHESAECNLGIASGLTMKMFLSVLFVTSQLLTFDTTASAAAPPATCLHLLYKQAVRRGPQVTAFKGAIRNYGLDT